MKYKLKTRGAHKLMKPTARPRLKRVSRFEIYVVWFWQFIGSGTVLELGTNRLAFFPFKFNTCNYKEAFKPPQLANPPNFGGLVVSKIVFNGLAATFWSKPDCEHPC
ncbi:hypothetical protein HanPI659440_Chr13g0519531 [Helianthus annuus]|nr:hypothetical protein HanPI659440_Chr13g0519531 [Helianthus annuus]